MYARLACKEYDEQLLKESQIPIFFPEESTEQGKLRLLSLFSGCGGMDIGFEGGFIAHRKSFAADSPYIDHRIDDDWIFLRKNRFETVFANDILPEAKVAWTTFMSRYKHSPETYRLMSVVDLVKMHQQGARVFPDDIDVLTGGFPCQDFSVAGKRKGFDSQKDHTGKVRTEDVPTEESRGKLYYWMKQVIDITRP